MYRKSPIYCQRAEPCTFCLIEVGNSNFEWNKNGLGIKRLILQMYHLVLKLCKNSNHMFKLSKICMCVGINNK